MFPINLKQVDSVSEMLFGEHLEGCGSGVPHKHMSPPGTVLFYQPGLLSGGSVDHDCSTQRSIGYYLEALLLLAPFMKSPLKATLRGVTNDPVDPTVGTPSLRISSSQFVPPPSIC